MFGDSLKEDTWRIFRIMAEFTEGFEKLNDIGPAVTVFGSARTQPDNKYYQEAVKLGGMLAHEGISVITGGGPGIMEAANKGAYEAKGRSIGLNIELPHEQKPNPYLTDSIDFHYFFARKVMFVKYATAFVIFPGGYGTLDELFESFTLIQTQIIKPFPVIMVGREYWEGLIGWLEDTMLARKNIDEVDLDFIIFAETAEEVTSIIKKHRERS
ncbi:MAG: TIGR00730 family Rossman fold protein [Spirochaetes bacterium]|nr:TIGR00730 family Rossman fold protein [Spirochaetota bacterium]